MKSLYVSINFLCIDKDMRGKERERAMIVKRTDILCIVSFKLYDVDHDGYLTKPELERVMLQLVNTSVVGHIINCLILLYAFFIHSSSHAHSLMMKIKQVRLRT